MPKRQLIGVVTSDKMNKSRRVEIDRLVKHKRYGKYIRRRTVLHVHDEKGEFKVGDIVRFVETRPLSKTKCWRLIEILEKAKAQFGAEEILKTLAEIADANQSNRDKFPHAIGHRQDFPRANEGCFKGNEDRAAGTDGWVLVLPLR